MTIRPLSRQEVRSLDACAAQELGLPTLLLMENAGRGAAECLRAEAKIGSQIVVACGPGNNGGDGGVIARHLDGSGYSVRVLWFAKLDKLTSDATTQWQILDRSGIDQHIWDGPVEAAALDLAFARADWIIDGLLGTGLTRPVEGYLRDVIEAINRSAKPVVALDIPSGLDADTGQPLGIAVRARVTVTFVARKVGFDGPGAAQYTGRVDVVDIGLPRRLLQPFWG